MKPSEYWRLCEDLSVIEAACLAVGKDPSIARAAGSDATASAEAAAWLGDEDEAQDEPENAPEPDQELQATFTALQRAVLQNRIPALVSYAAEPELRVAGDLEFAAAMEAAQAHDAAFIEFRVPNTAFQLVGGDFSDLPDAAQMIVHKEPDWSKTTVSVEALRRWFASRGLHPVFFFPEGRAEGFRDPQHPRYSRKLACAVAAWEANEEPAPNKSAKQTIETWVRRNADKFDLTDETGRPSEAAVEEISRVANWSTKGGATPTAKRDETPEAEICNFAVHRGKRAAAT